MVILFILFFHDAKLSFLPFIFINPKFNHYPATKLLDLELKDLSCYFLINWLILMLAVFVEILVKDLKNLRFG